MHIRTHCLTVVMLLMPLLGCATATEPTSWRLPAEISESSGLWCGPQGIYTLNDSGNASRLYQLTPEGALLRRLDIQAQNRDWEALTGDEQWLYVGDIGDNRGNRPQLQIYKIPHQPAGASGATIQPIQPDVITVRYADKPSGALPLMKHDFDAEALVARDQDLLLLSKSWASDTTRVYRIDKQQPVQRISPIAYFTTPDWIVTGAAYDATDGSLVLVGYQKNGFPLYSAVLARLSADLNQVSSRKLERGLQVEAVCLTADGSLLYTEENMLLSSGRLYRLPAENIPTVEITAD